MYKNLKEHAMERVNYEKKEITPLTYEENKSYEKQKACHICEGKFCADKDDENYKNRKKVKDHCHYKGTFKGAAHSKCNLNYKVPKDTSIIIHNASYDTHFIMNQLAEEFKGELDCIGIIWKNISGLSMNILRASSKSLVQRGLFTNSAGDLLSAPGFLGKLYNFCNFVIIFSLM